MPGEKGTAEQVLHDAPLVNPDANPQGVAVRVAHSSQPPSTPSLAPAPAPIPRALAAVVAAAKTPASPAVTGSIGSNPGLPSLARARAQVEAERRAASGVAGLGIPVPPPPPAVIPPSMHSPRTSGVSDARPTVVPSMPAPAATLTSTMAAVAPIVTSVPMADKPTLLARLKANGDPNERATPRPLLTPAEFLSLGGTLGNIPFAMPYRLALHALDQWPDVSGVYVAVAGLDETGHVPHADTVWVLTGANAEMTAHRLPVAYRPVIQWHGLMDDLPVADWLKTPAPGHEPVGLWWG